MTHRTGPTGFLVDRELLCQRVLCVGPSVRMYLVWQRAALKGACRRRPLKRMLQVFGSMHSWTAPLPGSLEKSVGSQKTHVEANG